MSEANMSQEHDNINGIKTYVIRIGRMTDAQKKNYASLSPVWCVPYERAVIDYEKLFGNKNPVVIEIGFGMGSATASIAEQNPNINYIGIEVHKPGVGKLLGEIVARKLQNIRIVEHDALEVLSHMIADNSVSGFHVFFPDPWPKKRHHKRRLVQRPRTELFVSKLVTDGYFYMATDWEEYAESALAELDATEHFANAYDEFADAQSWRPCTKFEKRGMDENRTIRELYFIKT